MQSTPLIDLLLLTFYFPFVYCLSVSGKEMNFIDLFKTLGLDMREVAGALGMDTTTLSRMDHEALLQLLTH